MSWRFFASFLAILTTFGAGALASPLSEEDAGAISRRLADDCESEWDTFASSTAAALEAQGVRVQARRYLFRPGAGLGVLLVSEPGGDTGADACEDCRATAFPWNLRTFQLLIDHKDLAVDASSDTAEGRVAEASLGCRFEARETVDVGNGYAASFEPDADSGDRLLVTVARDEPSSGRHRRDTPKAAPYRFRLSPDGFLLPDTR